MNTIRLAALSAALVLLSATALGQEKKEGAPAGTPPAATQAPPAATQAPPAAAKPASPPPADPRGVVKDGEFIPSQDIPPDEGVTFPVGI